MKTKLCSSCPHRRRLSGTLLHTAVNGEAVLIHACHHQADKPCNGSIQARILIRAGTHKAPNADTHDLKRGIPVLPFPPTEESLAWAAKTHTQDRDSE